jgi:hypothetical protein
MWGSVVEVIDAAADLSLKATPVPRAPDTRRGGHASAGRTTRAPGLRAVPFDVNGTATALAPKAARAALRPAFVAFPTIEQVPARCPMKSDLSRWISDLARSIRGGTVVAKEWVREPDVMPQGTFRRRPIQAPKAA